MPNPSYPSSDFPAAVDQITNFPNPEIPDAIMAVQQALVGGGPAGTGLNGLSVTGNITLSGTNPTITTGGGGPSVQFTPSDIIVSTYGGSNVRTGTGNGLALQGALTLRAGSGAPAAGLGANGDFYFRSDTPATANQRIYVKSAGAWVGIV